MRSEEQCDPCGRYLDANQYFSDNAIAVWKSECIERCKDKPRDQAYERYINWQRASNEIAVFTMYAYADFSIPKKFDIVFEKNNPANFIKSGYQLTQSIWEGWAPSGSIDHGHKHLCVFSFDGALPDILKLLHMQDEKFSTADKAHAYLGFCNSGDFESIRVNIERIISLKKQYGNNWWQHDDK